MKKIKMIILIALFTFGLVGCSGSKEKSEEIKDKELMMATTTSTADTGLLDVLAPKFKEDTGIELKFSAVGTGEALKMGENGDVDIVFVHSKKSEEKFVEDGFGVKRFPVMYNDFIIVGPKDLITPSNEVKGIFATINEKKLPFISRGDDSGTHKKELAIWKELEIDPSKNPKYIESGQGMGATITMAEEKKSITLTDRGTWLKMQKDSEIDMNNMSVICEKDKSLLNQYGVIAVDKSKHPETNSQAADIFIKWITSEEVQKFIEDFGVDKYGQPLFTPNANEKDA